MTRPALLVRPLLRWFATAARDLPWRHTRDPYAIWVAEVMLQQTTVAVVVPYFRRWMRELPTLAALAAAPLERVYGLWQGLGYYRRAHNLHRAAQTIRADFGGRFPRRHAEVLALPGIGPYTAGAICSIAFNQPTPVLDGNVTRVLARLHGLRQNPRSAAARNQLWQWAREWVEAAARLRQPQSRGRTNEALMELGATLCTPRNSRCPVCPLRRTCAARRQGCVDDIPAAVARPALVSRHYAALLFESRGRWLVRRRPAGGVNAGLWEFPQFEVPDGRSGASAAMTFAGVSPDQIEHVGQIKHTITRHRIQLEVYRARSDRPPREAGSRWCTPRELRELPFSSAHRRIAQWLEANQPSRPGSRRTRDRDSFDRGLRRQPGRVTRPGRP